jgi:hypothetical protein
MPTQPRPSAAPAEIPEQLGASVRGSQRSLPVPLRFARPTCLPAALSLALGAAGCTSGPSATNASGDGAVQDAGAHDEFVALPPCEPNLPSIQRNIFQMTCQWATCHGPPDPIWDLVLVDPDVEQRLVNVPAVGCRNWTLVEPGSLEKSYLWQKVSSDQPPCGDRMPWRPERLREDALECISSWILGLATDE